MNYRLSFIIKSQFWISGHFYHRPLADGFGHLREPVRGRFEGRVQSCRTERSAAAKPRSNTGPGQGGSDRQCRSARDRRQGSSGAGKGRSERRSV